MSRRPKSVKVRGGNGPKPDQVIPAEQIRSAMQDIGGDAEPTAEQLGAAVERVSGNGLKTITWQGQKPDGSAEPEPAPAPEPEPEPETEVVPEPESLFVPSALLLAAESVSPAKDVGREHLQGVFLHYKDGKGRVVATDGHRMFIASFGVATDKVPTWLRAKPGKEGTYDGGGLILSNNGLKAKIAMIVKQSEASGPLIRISWTKGNARVELSDFGREMVFQAPVQSGFFPDYERVIPAETFGALDGEGNPTGREWDPIGINSRYLKEIGDVAKTLEAGLPKLERSKTGMVVRAYASDPNRPVVFDFSTCPGAILILGAARLATPALAQETAKLLAPQVKLTIAALRAHATRNYAWAEAAKGEAKEEFRKKAEGFEARIAEVMKRAPGLKALAHTPAAHLPGDEAPAGEAAA